MTRGVPPWWLALAGSLLLHAALLFGLFRELPPQQPPSESLPIEARLIQLPPAELPRPSVRPPTPLSRPKPPPEPAAEIVAETAAPDVLDAAVAPEVDVRVDAAASVDGNAAEPELEIPPVVEAAAAGPSLNALPSRLDLRFQVRYGIARGEQTLVWISDGERYTITSVAAATGIAGVFYSGRFVQTSRGRIAPHGLAPEEFWDQRGAKRSSARFDAANQMLTLSPAQGAPRHFAYRGEVQDTLSLFFQLALTAPPEGRVGHQVFNGKRLRHYAHEVREEILLETELGLLRTLHLARLDDKDGRFELWLAIDRHYLPVRVLRTDDKGNEVELRVLSIAP